jgi:hypothetical protein
MTSWIDAWPSRFGAEVALSHVNAFRGAMGSHSALSSLSSVRAEGYRQLLPESCSASDIPRTVQIQKRTRT